MPAALISERDDNVRGGSLEPENREGREDSASDSGSDDDEGAEAHLVQGEVLLCRRLLHHHGLALGRRLQCRLLGLLLGLGLLRSRPLRCLGRALGRTLDQLLLGHLERAFRRRLVEAEERRRDLKGAELVVTSEDVVVSVVVAPMAGRREALRILLGLGNLYVNKLLVRTR